MKKLIRSIILVDVILMIIVGLIVFIGGWRTLYDYGQGLVYAGMLTIGLGVMSVWGNYSSTRSVNANSLFEENAIHASVRTPLERVKDDLAIVDQTYGCLLLMILVGVSVGAIGALLQAVAVT